MASSGSAETTASLVGRVAAQEPASVRGTDWSTKTLAAVFPDTLVQPRLQRVTPFTQLQWNTEVTIAEADWSTATTLSATAPIASGDVWCVWRLSVLVSDACLPNTLTVTTDAGAWTLPWDGLQLWSQTNTFSTGAVPTKTAVLVPLLCGSAVQSLELTCTYAAPPGASAYLAVDIARLVPSAAELAEVRAALTAEADAGGTPQHRTRIHMPLAITRTGTALGENPSASQTVDLGAATGDELLAVFARVCSDTDGSVVASAVHKVEIPQLSVVVLASVQGTRGHVECVFGQPAQTEFGTCVVQDGDTFVVVLNTSHGTLQTRSTTLYVYRVTLTPRYIAVRDLENAALMPK